MQTLTAGQILEILQRGESETVEFKKVFDREAVETLTAFANTHGGRVFVGISDSGHVLGTDVGKETIQNWINQVKLSTANTLIPDVEVGLIEKYGTGIQRILRGFAEHGLPESKFEEIGEGFRVTVYRQIEKATVGELTPQVTPQVTSEVERLLSICMAPKSRVELQRELGLSDKKHFRAAYLNPSLKAGLIELTYPDKPRSRFQKYRLTAKGKNVLEKMARDRT